MTIRKRLTTALAVTMIAVAMTIGTTTAKAENYPYRSDYLWVTVPNHSDWLYRSGENATVEVQLYKYGVPQEVTLDYELSQDMLQPTKKGTVTLHGGKATVEMGTMKKPGFLDCKFTATIDGKKTSHHVKVGFDAEKIQPKTENPKDFDEFWKTTLDEARKTPLKYTITKSDLYTTDKIDAYLVRIQTDRSHCIYGYLTRPKKAGKYPVVMCPPGAGVKTIKEPLRHKYYAENGMIRLEMEIHGLNPELKAEDFKDAAAAFGGYLTMGLDNKENYYMRHVYVGCVKAIDFLTSLDDWDGVNVAVQGGSQGGALAIVTAALADKVTLCVANHPALSDMAGYEDGGTGGYPHFNKMNGMMTKEKIRTMAYYDVVNFARRLSCPTRITWGYNDNACPPTTSYAVWNVITAPKEALITPINEHWTSETTEYSHYEWIKNHLK